MRQSQRQSMLLMRVLYWAATSWLFTHIHSKRSWWIANDTDLFSKLWMDSQRQLDRRSWRRSLARSFAKFRKLMLTSITPTAISRQMQHMTRPVTFVRKIGVWQSGASDNSRRRIVPKRMEVKVVYMCKSRKRRCTWLEAALNQAS